MNQYLISIRAKYLRPVEIRVFAPDPKIAVAFALNSQEASVHLMGETPLAVDVSGPISALPLDPFQMEKPQT